MLAFLSCTFSYRTPVLLYASPVKQMLCCVCFKMSLLYSGKNLKSIK